LPSSSAGPAAPPAPAPAPPPPPAPAPAPQPTTGPAPPAPPAPPYGYDPYGYGYGYPYGYGYSQPTPPKRLPYQPGEPTPRGYRLDTQLRKGFVIAGAVTFGSTYLISVAVGAALQQEAEAADFTPLFVPLAGPFIATGTTDATAFGTFALIVDGLSQVFGLGMFLFGVLEPEKVWVRNQTAAKPLPIDVTPIFVDGRPAGAGVTGTF
jgi:hypothetical protein